MTDDRFGPDGADSAFHAVFQAVPDPYLLLSPDEYRIVDASDAYLAAANTQRAAIVGKRLFDVFPDDPDDPAADGVRKLSDSLARVKERRAPDAMARQRYSVRRLGSAGGGFEERFWDPVNVPVFGPGGEIRYIVHRVADVTALVKSERRNRLILDSLGEGVHGLDTDGRIVFENRAALTMLGWPAEELIGRKSHPTIHHHRADGEEYPIEQCPIYRTLRDGETRRVGDEVFFRRDGTPLAVDYTCSPLLDETGGIDGAVVVFEDVSSRRREEVLRRAETRILEAISSGAAIESTFESVVRAMEAALPGARASILVLDGDRTRLRYGAAPTMPASFNRTIDGLPVGEGSGVCGTAAHRGRPVVVADVETDPLVSGFRELARTHGIRACWSTPVLDRAGNVIATFAIYHNEARAPTAEEQALTARAAHLVGIAIGRQLDDATLRASEERFRSVFRDAATGMIVTDTEQRFVAANAAFLRMLGYSESELREKNVAGITHPDDWPENARLFREMKAGKRTGFTFEKRYLPKDGGILWARLSVSVQRDAAGRTVGSISIVEDITERKRSEQALIASEERFRSTFRDAAIGMTITDSNHRFVTANAAFSRMLGYGADELQGKDVASITHPDDWSENARLFRELMAGKKTGFTFEKRFVPKGGGLLWARLSVSAHRDSAGKVVGAIAIIEDITERKRATQALIASEERFRSIFRDAATGMAITDTEGRFVAANAAYCRMLGYTEEELRATKFEELTHPEDRERNNALFGELMSGRRKVFTLEKRYLTKSGGILWCRLSVSAHRDPAGTIVGCIGMIEDITERKRAEQALIASEERFRSTFRDAATGMAITDTEGRFVAVNAAYCRMLGYTEEELRATKFENLTHPDDRKRNNALFGELVLGRREAFTLEKRYITKTGGILWCRLSVSVHRDPAGTIVGSVGIVEDITERKRAEQALIASEERFRLLARATSDAIWDWDLHTDTLWWNEGFETLFGYRRDEIEPTIVSWKNRIHPEDIDRVVSGVYDAIAGGAEFWSDEYRFRRSDRNYAYVLDRGYVIRDSVGKATRMIGGISDITERKLVEQRLADQAALLDVTQDAIIVRDIDHRVLFWNRSAERLYGWTAAEATGRSTEELLYSDPGAFQCATATVMERGQWSGRIVQRRKDGNALTVEGNWTLVLDAKGRPRSILAVNTDVSEKLALEEQLRQSQRLEAVGKLTGGIAHDFNNLLTVILGNTELLTEELAGNDDLRAMAEMTMTAAQRGADLTRRLLAFARRQALEPKAVDINRLLSDMRSLLRRTLAENITIDFLGNAELWSAFVDPSQLENAVLNLCINARDAMPGGGRLIIQTANTYLDREMVESLPDVAAGAYVMIAVSDTGTGIPPDIIKKVFDPFFTTKEPGKGTGLGLSMVYGFIKQSGGHISIYSEVGQGTTVKLFLPRVRGGAGPQERVEEDEAPVGGSETILMVEDDEMVRAHVERQLRTLGYRVLVASNGKDAVEIVRSEPSVDLLFTDVIMPGGMNGKEVADAAREIRPGLKVLFTSGYTEDAIVHQGRLDPGVRLLSKPYRQIELARTLRSILDSSGTGSKP